MDTNSNDKLDTIKRCTLAYLNKTPELLSLLYDLNMLPEQLEEDSYEWYQMVIIVTWYHGLMRKNRAAKNNNP